MTHRLTTVSRIARRAAALLVLLSSVAQAHAIHTTMTQVTADGQTVTLMIRAFADDLAASVAKSAGKPLPSGAAMSEADLLRYVRAQFAIRDAGGVLIQLQPCGTRRAEDLVWVCVRATMPRGLKGAWLRNQMMTESHTDQVNVVQVENQGARRTVLFTKASTPALLSD